MNRKLKSQLQKAFDVPAPTRKSEFLQSINFPKTSRFDFILGQIGYIRKKVWTLSCLLVAATLLGLEIFANSDTLDSIWIVSSILPFVSLMTITEIARSTSHNMAELEMSCKYNLADIVLVRLSILSCFNIALFGFIIFSFLGNVDFDTFRLVIYLLVPFMLTCVLALLVLNRLRSRETTYICCAISCFVCMANAFFSRQYQIVFSDEYLSFWCFTFVILVIWLVIETIKLVKKMGELQWNLL